MSALLEQHDGFCRCRACKPPLSALARDDEQPTKAAMLGAAVLVTIIGAIGGGAVVLGVFR